MILCLAWKWLRSSENVSDMKKCFHDDPSVCLTGMAEVGGWVGGWGAYTPPPTHFLYRVLEGKKTTRSQFSVRGLRVIHRNLKQEKKNNSRESFFSLLLVLSIHEVAPFCLF